MVSVPSTFSASPIVQVPVPDMVRLLKCDVLVTRLLPVPVPFSVTVPVRQMNEPGLAKLPLALTAQEAPPHPAAVTSSVPLSTVRSFDTARALVASEYVAPPPMPL